eukprot:Protomagalhaensia_wolfi_Nauph_80__4219@NODE_429_length_2537_cov_380_777422_g322_i0_p2_GENE_NODE_429_length_2537_cov_380_777422_g322_i0NODE_429_length_2537_cov_380_777422_g322_i0_p2_ORF_typecomplete_len179_score23_15DUF438/PF04282_13/0_12Shisa/PF13908_6/0_23_NODE_429_length_2537_cov_380_777422_g322_i016562192
MNVTEASEGMPAGSLPVNQSLEDAARALVGSREDFEETPSTEGALMDSQSVVESVWNISKRLVRSIVSPDDAVQVALESGAVPEGLKESFNETLSSMNATDIQNITRQFPFNTSSIMNVTEASEGMPAESWHVGSVSLFLVVMVGCCLVDVLCLMRGFRTRQPDPESGSAALLQKDPK